QCLDGVIDLEVVQQNPEVNVAARRDTVGVCLTTKADEGRTELGGADVLPVWDCVIVHSDGAPLAVGEMIFHPPLEGRIVTATVGPARLRRHGRSCPGTGAHAGL